jgi:hypothetical protein
MIDDDSSRPIRNYLFPALQQLDSPAAYFVRYRRMYRTCTRLFTPDLRSRSAGRSG